MVIVSIINQVIQYNIQSNTDECSHKATLCRSSYSCNRIVFELLFGKKQFEREFYSYIGMNPKEYSRIVRFQKTLRQMQNQQGKINQVDLVYSNGYSDQSHLIREFKKLCGYTPLTLFEVSTPYSDLFTTPIQKSHLFYPLQDTSFTFATSFTNLKTEKYERSQSSNHHSCICL